MEETGRLRGPNRESANLDMEPLLNDMFILLGMFPMSQCRVLGSFYDVCFSVPI